MGRSVKVVYILIFLFILLPVAFSQTKPKEPTQTVDGFTLYGFGQDGNKAWEIHGKSANIFDDQIRLNDFVGKFYDKEEIVLTADKGDFDKVQNRVHLEKDVVITTESGAELTTDYLDWDRGTSLIETEAAVDIKRDNMVLTGVGINGSTNLRSVALKKDIRLEIDDIKNKITIICTGPLNINYAANIAVFNNDVVVDDGQSQMYADLMQVFFKSAGSDNSASSFASREGNIQKIIARGNVKIAREDNLSFSNEAIYNASDKTLNLTGRPRLIIYSTEDIDASIGN